MRKTDTYLLLLCILGLREDSLSQQCKMLTNSKLYMFSLDIAAAISMYQNNEGAAEKNCFLM